MKQLYLVFAFVMSSILSAAQCTFTIPMSPGHVQVSSSQSMALSGTVYWVCENVDLTVTASTGATIVLEQNATVTFDGSDGDEVYAKPGCVVTNNSSTSIGVTHDPATTTLNNNGSGSITTTASCSPLIYDYQFVGGGPCSASTGISESHSDTGISLFPNPVQVGGTLQIDGSPDHVEIYGITGAMIKQVVSPGSGVELNSIPSGIYVVKVFLNDQIVTRRLVVE